MPNRDGEHSLWRALTSVALLRFHSRGTILVFFKAIKEKVRYHPRAHSEANIRLELTYYKYISSFQPCVKLVFEIIGLNDKIAVNFLFKNYF